MKIKLFCIPYAGGSSLIYYKFKNYLSSDITVHPIELAGRGINWKKPLYKTFQGAVDDIYENIKNELSGDKYAIFGHSMGAWLAYELYYKVCDANLVRPVHMFFSGRAAPSIKLSDSKIYSLSDEGLINELKKIGGMSSEVLENEEFLHESLNIIRSDIKLLDQYKFNHYRARMDCPITVITGKADIKYNFHESMQWRYLASNKIQFANLEGGHFYINTNTKELCELINNTLIKI